MKHLITIFVCVAAAALEGATVRQATEGFVTNAVGIAYRNATAYADGAASAAASAAAQAATNYADRAAVLAAGELRRDLTNGSVRVAEAIEAASADTAHQASTATGLSDGDYDRDATTILRQLDAATAATATNAAQIAAVSLGVVAVAYASTNYANTVGATKAAISNAVITATDVDYWTAAGGGMLPRITEGAEPGWYSWGPNGISGNPILDYSQSERAYYYAPTISTTYYTNNPAFTGNEIALDFGGGVTLRRTLAEYNTNYYGVVYADGLAAATNDVVTVELPKATRYTIGDVAAAATMQLKDRAINCVALSTNVTTAAFAMPMPTDNRARDLMLNLTYGESAADTGTLTLDLSDPALTATGAAMIIDFGADTLADVAAGRNLILITEIAPASVSNSHWLVSAKHEDFAQ